MVGKLAVPKGVTSAFYRLKRLGTDCVYKWLILRRWTPQGRELSSEVTSFEILHWLFSKTWMSQRFHISQSAAFHGEVSTLSPQLHDRRALDGQSRKRWCKKFGLQN